MFKNDDRPIKPFIFVDKINEVIEEKGNQFTALRTVQWIKEGDEPDPNKGKLELRRWMIDKDGSEKANKGVVFMTEEGPHQLVEIMVDNNYGNTKNIMKSIIKRQDFKESVINLNKDESEESSDGDYFDMRDMLLSYSEEDNKGVDDGDEE